MHISVIIPTRNRLPSLKDTIKSIKDQTFEKDDFELLIMDQSTDGQTKDFSDSLKDEGELNIRYFYNEIPGLHSSRNLGGKLAKGDILFFTDDDVLLAKDYLQIIDNTFKENKNIAILAGKVLPAYKGDIPEWLDFFWQDYKDGKYIWQISLVDLGNKQQEIIPDLVFGCNYIIKRKLFIKFKGTNPDIFSANLMKYSGSSEIALSYKIKDAGLQINYEPNLVLWHIVSKKRLDAEYFYRRNLLEGIKKSYFDIRKTGKRLPIKQMLRDKYLFLKSIIIIIFKFCNKPHRIQFRSMLSNLKGRFIHKWWVLKDKRLFEYILRDNYFDKGKEFL